MSYNCPNPIDGFGFTQAEIQETAARGGLLSMEIEFSLACDFRCPYCYAPNAEQDASLTPDEIRDAICQARDLGARKIIILGGEPMLYSHVHDIITFIHDQGLAIELFSNGSHMTLANARFMFNHDVAVVLKMNSFKPEVQNLLTGRQDSYAIIQRAFANMEKAGYPAPGKRWAVSTVICKPNLDELPDLWRWLRTRGIEPYFEMITPQGNATENDAWLTVSSAEQHTLFDTLAAIDRDEFGHDWDPQPPLVGNRCLRHQFSCLVNAFGEVLPCVGVTIPLGNLREQPLAEILDKSEVMENLRKFPEMIKAPCGTCDKAAYCYGCRGAAYQLTGDYLAADPLCWRNADASIVSLPTDVRPYLPQAEPMCLVDTLLAIGERRAELATTIRADGIFVDAEGNLDPCCFLEIIAQSIAGMHGFNTPPRIQGQHRGFLLGARELHVHGSAHCGDHLHIALRKVGRYGDFGIVEGTITRDGERLARGEVKVWQITDENAEVPV